MSTSDDLDNLALSIQNGDRDLIPELWRRMRGYAYRVIRNWEKVARRTGFEIDDLSQESFIALLKAVDAYTAGGNFVMLFRYNVLSRFVRAAGLKSEHNRQDPLNIPFTLPLDATLTDYEDGSPLVELIPDTAAAQAICDVDEADRIERLHDALEAAINANLTRKQAQALRLRYFEGLTVEQVSERLGCSRQNVHLLISGGIARLRKPSASKQLEGFLL